MNYLIKFIQDTEYCKLSLIANDSAHAQAQSKDISRALDASSYELLYDKKNKPDLLSTLFMNLAGNNFTQTTCTPWQGKFSNSVPCVYVFKKRKYIRSLILKYLDIPRDGAIATPRCSCKSCINPYHFIYNTAKNVKISDAAWNLALQSVSQGASVSQLSSALNVHRSTIYRKLKNERISPRTKDHS